MINQLILKQLKIKNFLSHKDTELEFSEVTRMLIDGNSGAGKSSIIDAIIWALYNKSRSGSKSIIRSKSKSASVDLIMKRGDLCYRILRSITSTGKHELQVFLNYHPVEAAGVKEQQEYIENTILNSSYELFVNSIAYPQDNVDSFIKQSQAKRKDILLEILRTKSFNEILVKTKTLLSTVNSAESFLQGQIEWYKKSNLEHNTEEDIKDEIDRLELEYTHSLEESKKALREETKNRLNIEKISEIRNKISRLQDAQRDKEIEMEKVLSFDWEGKKNLVEKKEDYKKLVKYYDYLEIKSLNDVVRKSGKCTFCGKLNPDIEKKLTKEVPVEPPVGLYPSIGYLEAWDKMNASVSAESSLSFMEKMMPSVEECKSRLKEIKHNLNKLWQEDLDLHDSVEKYTSSKTDWVAEGYRLKARVEKLQESKKMIKEIEELESKLKLTSETQGSLALLKDALGPNGIKAMVTEMILPSLEDKINSVLSTLSDMRIRLVTEKDNAKEDGTVEGLFIYVVNESGEELEISNYSGGEKVKIVTAISEGLASMQNIGFRLFDENIVGLDEETVEGFVKVIGTVGKSFSQLLCISHLPRIKELFDEKINIIKVGGISSVD